MTVSNPFEREAASRDLWVRNQIAFLQGQSAPSAADVVRPASVAELAVVVKEAVAAGRPIVPLGAGSGVCGAIACRGEELVIDLKALTDIDVDSARGIARFGAGVMGRHAEEACNRVGFTIGHFPSSIACSTVGGWVAARGAGQLSSRYGKIEDICVGATAVLPDGSTQTAWRGSRELAEWIGNEGTLALLTEVYLRIRPQRQGWTFTAYMAPNLGIALKAASLIIRQRPIASLLRVYDPIDSRIALSHSKGGLARKLPWMLAAPRAILTAGDLALRKCLVVVGWEGEGPAWDAARTASDAIAGALACRHLGSGPGEVWLARRHDVSFKQIAVLRSGYFADTFEVGCPWTRVEPVYNAVRKAISPGAVSMAHFSHAYTDGSAIYFSMAGKLDAYDATWTRALKAASDAGATISHHHGVGRLKAQRMIDELGGAHGALVQAKAEYDPAGLLNPGCLGLPSQPRTVPPHVGFAGLDVGNGLWCGPLSDTLGAIEATVRPRGWTLGAAANAQQTLGAWLANDLIDPQASQLGNARSRVVALEGTLADGTPFGTRVAPRFATGPDLRPRLLDGDHHVERATLRLVRQPQHWRHLYGEFDSPLDTARAMAATGIDIWASVVKGTRLDIWLACGTPGERAVANKVDWSAQQDESAPDAVRGAHVARKGRFLPWKELAEAADPDAIIVGVEAAGGWLVEGGR